MQLTNARESIKMDDEDLTKETDFDNDDLLINGRESILIFSSIVNETTKHLTLEDFEIAAVLGKGTFGKVYLTVLKDTRKLYAIKAIRKDILIETD